jgi:hypothetical protein
MRTARAATSTKRSWDSRRALRRERAIEKINETIRDVHLPFDANGQIVAEEYRWQDSRRSGSPAPCPRMRIAWT